MATTRELTIAEREAAIFLLGVYSGFQLRGTPANLPGIDRKHYQSAAGLAMSCVWKRQKIDSDVLERNVAKMTEIADLLGWVRFQPDPAQYVDRATPLERQRMDFHLMLQRLQARIETDFQESFGLLKRG